MTSTPLKCGHTGQDWNGEGDCITCARDKVLGMAQSNEQGGDVPTGLDEAVRMFAGYVRGENGFDELDFKEWLIEWRNKQVEEVLDRLYETGKRYEQVIEEYDNGSRLIQNGYVPLNVIEAERNRLKNP